MMVRGKFYKRRLPELGMEDKSVLKLSYVWPLHYDAVLSASAPARQVERAVATDLLFEKTPV